MDNDEIINKALLELKNHDKLYILVQDLSFIKKLNLDSTRLNKITYILIKSLPFEKHTNKSIRLSEKGIEIINDYKDWFDYKKSIRPKINYAKWVAIAIAALSLIWNIYQGIINNDLKDRNRILHDEIEALEKEIEGYKNQLKNLFND
jgi:predicted transcriptional regulator